MDGYKQYAKIGKGAYGTTYLVYSDKMQQFYCQKIIQLEGLDNADKEKSKQEIEVLGKLNHENIVHLYDSAITEKHLSMIMEYCGSGDLDGVIKRSFEASRNIPENIVIFFFVQIVRGLEHVHGTKILHRDLKPSNIFLTNEGIPKIGDFGISRVLIRSASLATSTLGTPYYLSPEVCSSKPYDHKSDIWSLGCILYELCSLKHVYEGNNLMALVLKIMNNDVPAIPNIYDPSLSKLFKKMLSKDAENRPSATEILKDIALKGYEKANNKRIPAETLKEFLPPEKFDLSTMLKSPIEPFYDEDNIMDPLPSMHKSSVDAKTKDYYAPLSESKLYGTGIFQDNNAQSHNYDKFLDSNNNIQNLGQDISNNNRNSQTNVYHNKLNESKLAPINESKLSATTPQIKPPNDERPITAKGYYDLPPQPADVELASQTRLHQPRSRPHHSDEFQEDFEEVDDNIVSTTLEKYNLTQRGQQNNVDNRPVKTIIDDRPLNSTNKFQGTLDNRKLAGTLPKAEIVPTSFSNGNLKVNIINQIGRETFDQVYSFYQKNQGQNLAKQEILSKFPSVNENILQNIEIIFVFDDMHNKN